MSTEEHPWDKGLSVPYSACCGVSPARISSLAADWRAATLVPGSSLSEQVGEKLREQDAGPLGRALPPSGTHKSPSPALPPGRDDWRSSGIVSHSRLLLHISDIDLGLKLMRTQSQQR